jgi:hypothetical protein
MIDVEDAKNVMMLLVIMGASFSIAVLGICTFNELLATVFTIFSGIMFGTVLLYTYVCTLPKKVKTHS